MNKEETIFNATHKVSMQIVDKQNDAFYEMVVEDINEHPEKYDFIEFKTIERDRIKKLLNLGLKVEPQILELTKYKNWIEEFIEKYKVDMNNSPEYSKNPIIEYCMQIEDLRTCDLEELKSFKDENEYFRKEMLRDGETFTMSQAKFLMI